MVANRLKTISFSFFRLFLWNEKRKRNYIEQVFVLSVDYCCECMPLVFVCDFAHQQKCSLNLVQLYITRIEKHCVRTLHSTHAHHFNRLRLSCVCFLPSMASLFALFAIQYYVPVQWAQYPCYTTVVNHECQALSAHSFAAVSFRMRTSDSGHLICSHCMLPLPVSLLMFSHHQSQDLIPSRQVDALDALRHFIFFFFF